MLNNTADYMRSSNGDFSNNDTDEYVLQADWQLGENTLTIINAYSKYDFSELCDCDFTGGNVFSVLMDEEFDQTSHEIRLTSPTGGKLEYILGAYYESSDLEFRDTIQVPANSVLVPILNANPAFNGTPLQGIAGTAVAATGTPRLFKQDAKSYSAFAQVSWNMNEEIRSTFGLRYSKDEKDATRTLRITEIDGDPLVGLQAAAAPQVYAAVFNVRRTDLHNLSGSRDEDQLLPSMIARVVAGRQHDDVRELEQGREVGRLRCPFEQPDRAAGHGLHGAQHAGRAACRLPASAPSNSRRRTPRPSRSAPRRASATASRSMPRCTGPSSTTCRSAPSTACSASTSATPASPRSRASRSTCASRRPTTCSCSAAWPTPISSSSTTSASARSDSRRTRATG